MSDSWYYNFMNIDDCVKQNLIKGGIDISYIRYIYDIPCIKLSMFNYEGELPELLTSTILETALLFVNNLCFYKIKGTNQWTLCRYIYGSQYNIYWKPDKVNLMALNGMHLQNDVPYKDIILVKDNPLDIIPFLVIEDYISKLITIEDDTFKIASLATLPAVLSGNKKQAAALKKIAQELGTKNAFITGDDTITDSLKSFNINLPISPLDLYDLRRKYRNECLSSLGIYAVEEKRERIVTQELKNQNDYTDYVYQMSKKCRQDFVNALNKTGEFNIKLIENRIITKQANIYEQAKLAGDKVKAQAEAIKKVDPSATLGGVGIKK